ncbi:MAG: HU family DNA-binding protein, partial [Planctomycetota bacterium]|nr:HU family DNA-binding protein [Planctomycetota bacterium]
MATMTKKSTAKKSTKSAKVVKKAYKPTTTTKARTRSQIIAELATASDIKKTVVKEVFENLGAMIGCDLSGRGPGVFSFMGLMKMKTVKKPATKSREGINPFTGLT